MSCLMVTTVQGSSFLPIITLRACNIVTWQSSSQAMLFNPSSKDFTKLSMSTRRLFFNINRHSTVTCPSNLGHFARRFDVIAAVMRLTFIAEERAERGKSGIGVSHFMTRGLTCAQRENLLRQPQIVDQALDARGGRCVRITLRSAEVGSRPRLDRCRNPRAAAAARGSARSTWSARAVDRRSWSKRWWGRWAAPVSSQFCARADQAPTEPGRAPRAGSSRTGQGWTGQGCTGRRAGRRAGRRTGCRTGCRIGAAAGPSARA